MLTWSYRRCRRHRLVRLGRLSLRDRDIVSSRVQKKLMTTSRRSGRRGTDDATVAWRHLPGHFRCEFIRQKGNVLQTMFDGAVRKGTFVTGRKERVL